jgi:hypothetical protein
VTSGFSLPVILQPFEMIAIREEEEIVDVCSASIAHLVSRETKLTDIADYAFPQEAADVTGFLQMTEKRRRTTRVVPLFAFDEEHGPTSLY